MLALLDDQPLDDHPSLQALLTVTAARCASEVQRANAEQALALGYRLERGLAACARALLSDQRSSRALDVALRPLAEATDAARVVLYGHEPDEIEGLRLVHLAKACRGKSPPTVHQRLPIAGRCAAGRTNWVAASVSAVWCACCRAASRRCWRRTQVQSVLALPVVVRNRWAGMLRFDAETARRWQRDEIRLLRTASEMIGVYVGTSAARRGDVVH